MPKVHLGVQLYPGKSRMAADISAAAKMKKKTMQDVADEAMIHRATLYARLNNPGDLRICEVLSIAKSTGMDPVELLSTLLGRRC